LVHKEKKVLLVPEDHQGHPDHQDPKDHQEKKVRKEVMDL
jgi:hypothetical protein